MRLQRIATFEGGWPRARHRAPSHKYHQVTRKDFHPQQLLEENSSYREYVAGTNDIAITFRSFEQIPTKLRSAVFVRATLLVLALRRKETSPAERLEIV